MKGIREEGRDGEERKKDLFHLEKLRVQKYARKNAEESM